MIIGISGKMGSGKDTVGNIIQYLTHCKDDNTTWEQWNNTIHQNFGNWRIKRFADKLKDIVCLLIGCTREQLEDREFKEKELGEEWRYYTFIIPHPLNRSPIEVTNKLFTSIEEGEKHFEKLGYSKNRRRLVTHKLTPRKLLQLLGTECGRDIIHPNIWVNALFSEYRQIGSTYKDGNNPMIGEFIEDKPIFPNWVITDMRFPNELKAVKDRDGITIRVNRKPSKHHLESAYQHPSEAALDNAEFDYIIDNNGTIKELIKQVRQILIKEKII